jgi:Protein of unknown function (DUF2892)
MRNIGGMDRIIRVVLGIGLLALVFYGPETRWGWLGLVPLLTAVVGFCPLYRLLGISTNHADDGRARTAKHTA